MNKFILHHVRVVFLIGGFVISTNSCKTAIKAPAYQPMTGDIVLQEEKSGQARAVKLATGSRFSHCGVVVIENGTPFVLEAIQPVTKTLLSTWKRRGVHGIFCAMRLKPGKPTPRPLTAETLLTYFEKQAGKNYDGRFQWGDEELYCSELVWKAYEAAAGFRLCEPRAFKEYALEHASVQHLISERYGSTFNPEEKAVSPEDLFRSPYLHQVSR
jgi:hypothetical protein